VRRALEAGFEFGERTLPIEARTAA